MLEFARGVGLLDKQGVIRAMMDFTGLFFNALLRILLPTDSNVSPFLLLLFHP